MTNMVLRDSTLESLTTSVNALAHSIATTHPTCVFFSLANDTHIVDSVSNVSHILL